MKDFLHHLFIPRSSNNHRSKLLHHSSLFTLVGVLLVCQVLLNVVAHKYPQVLGLQFNITSSDLLKATNSERQKVGLGPLQLNDQLALAAHEKAKDMFAKDYWAHNSPDGLTPWVFIQNAGYTYVYAGENLARGFDSSEAVVAAWMASPSHRENMLSPHYQDVGFAIVPGRLLGEDTVLVVEEFGNKTTEIAAQAPTEQPADSSTPTPASLERSPFAGSSSQPIVAALESKPLLDIKKISFFIGFFVLFILLATLMIDMVVIEKNKVTRVVGHNLDHMLLLGAIAILILLAGSGAIL